MATALKDWSSTAASNTSLDAITLDGGVMTPSQVDDAFRELMEQVATQRVHLLNYKGADIASATTTDLSTATGQIVDITGTTTITGFGTVASGIFILRFTGALTLTHNATSLILPTGANITTVAGDAAIVVSLGSGNWCCIAYTGGAPITTPWVAYTPTFTGFGSASSITFHSRRVGDTLHIRGRWTSGTPTAVEARITLGYNGTNSNVTSDSSKVPSGGELAGYMTSTLAGAGSYVVLIEPSVGYITFGFQSSIGGGFSKQNGSAITAAANACSIMAEIPISGW